MPIFYKRGLLLLALLSFSFCKISLLKFDNANTAHYQCIKQNGFGWITLNADTNSSGIQKESVQNIYNAQNAGLDVELLWIPCRGFSPENQAQIILKNIEFNSYRRIWICPLSDPSDAQCSWNSFTP